MHEPKQREFTFEHLLVGELSRHCWVAGKPLDVTVSRCDTYGYDLVLHLDGTVRYLQMKTRLVNSRTEAASHYDTVKPVCVPGQGALVVLDVCAADGSVANIYARRLKPKEKKRVSVGLETRCASIADLIQMLFGFKPPVLASPGLS